MIVEAIEPKTGKAMRVECTAQSEDEIMDLLSFDLSEDALRKRINALAVSADVKSILFTIAKTTIKVGTLVVKIGRKVLDIVSTIIAEFPMASTGTIFGAIFGYLVTAVPIIGFALGPLIGALAIAFGFAVGAIQDFANKNLESRIKSAVFSFDPLKSKV